MFENVKSMMIKVFGVRICYLVTKSVERYDGEAAEREVVEVDTKPGVKYGEDQYTFFAVGLAHS